MRRLFAAALAAAFCAGAVTGPVAAAPAKPSASVQFGASVVVKGVRFKPRERVAVSIVGDETWKKVATANAKGTFSADFGAISLNDCARYTLKVVGSKGSRFALSHPALPC